MKVLHCNTDFDLEAIAEPRRKKSASASGSKRMQFIGQKGRLPSKMVEFFEKCRIFLVRHENDDSEAVTIHYRQNQQQVHR